ncbi:hypothetical protein C4585_02245 [Candidatus Parcubacteria bacterium]|nr:MAG: hypothetical protein C4585_02245 [Candidatus Parcubacteria bacterium]
MKNRFTWLLATLVALGIVMVVVALTTDMNPIGVAISFLYRSLAYGVMWVVNGFRQIALLFISRRAWATVSALASVGLWYALRVFLSDEHMKKFHGWRERFRQLLARASGWWNGLGTWKKIGLIVSIIYLQIVLLPVVSEYIVLFPVRTVATILINIAKRVYGTLGETIFGALYRKYFGKIHNKVVHRARAIWVIQTVRGSRRYIRLQNLTAWRIWMYDPRYRDGSGKRWRSLIEPVRLWRRGELEKYRRRPLLSGNKRNDKHT